MDTTTQGLMGPDDTIIDNFRNAILGNQRPKTLTQLLGDLSPEDAAQVQSMARLTRMNAQTYVRSQGYMEQSYEDLVKQLHRRLRPDLQAIVAMLLEQIDPVEVREKPKPDPLAAQLSIYDDWNASVSEAKGGIPKVTEQDIEEFSAAAGLTKEASEPEQLSFLDRLEASESSGKADAEITIKDGRRFVGKLQFGKARLQDYQKATGTTFTQDEFIKDAALQNKVATWHIADLDKAIDALGDAAADYDRDGLRAVAHLGGKSGMNKFVQSKGSYNPADELGTSLQSYYEKFRNCVMFYRKISLPENHSNYPSLRKSDCNRFRIIRCTDDIQWIVQAYRTPKWRSLSYHTEWWSIHMRWCSEAPFATLPVETF